MLFRGLLQNSVGSPGHFAKNLVFDEEPGGDAAHDEQRDHSRRDHKGLERENRSPVANQDAKRNKLILPMNDVVKRFQYWFDIRCFEGLKI